ncbi:VOC family protein [Chitinophaga filiformis]|uniref:VOC family protein n=1 Tax=Chitinophaga filiformis TaxID=104663 RepID=UPI001F32B8A7|nr:VOC family protein [Chitinophaga filiformis]MCF6406397.1 VOC family protein [Chitinophaga filiformis]
MKTFNFSLIIILIAVACSNSSIQKKRTMEQRLSILTIGVKDLSAVRTFYEQKFGWTPEAVNKDIVFYKINGSLISFFPAKALAEDAKVPYTEGSSGHYALGYIVNNEKEVDELFAQLESKGVTIVKRPVKTFFGAYSGYVQDVEGNLWDIGTNPLIPLDAQNNVVAHKDIRHLEQQ